MKCNYSLTFEFETAKPVTVKGVAVAGSLRTVLARAADDAVTKHPKMAWSSLVIVLERGQIDTKEEGDLTE